MHWSPAFLLLLMVFTTLLGGRGDARSSGTGEPETMVFRIGDGKSTPWNLLPPDSTNQ